MWLLFLLTAFTGTDIDCNDLTQVRQEFHEVKTEENLISYIEKLQASDCENMEPYLASCIMRQAEYDFSPIKKLDHFNKGKNRLEQFIAEHPDNVEARYVRILVQKSCPSILFYDNDIQNDAIFIRSNISKSDLPIEYQELILDNLEKI